MTLTARGCLLAAGFILLSSCQSPEASGDLEVAPSVVQSVTRYRREYVLVPGDTLDIVVRGHPDISRTFSRDGRGVIVRPDGYLSVPLLNDVKAAGLTIPQLDSQLTEMFTYRLVDPEVTVIWLSPREPMIYVVGEVLNPQPVAHRLAITAAQAITYAGGLNPNTAAKDKVVLIRLTDDGYLRAYTIPTTIDGQPGPYMALAATVLQADDIIFVPETGIRQFDRWINQYINVPLSGVNSTLAPITNFLLIQEIIEDG